MTVLSALREDSATGPDLLPARVLKHCARQLAKPISMLILRIISTMEWPAIWMVHWITALHKRGPVFLRKNYRAVHLTCQISKVVERLIKQMIEPHLERINAYGENQFAYRRERGSRDALALLVLTWIKKLSMREKVAVYCSDVAGAFDRVC